MALVTNDRKATGLITSMNIIQNVTLASLKRFSKGGFLQPGAERLAAARQATALNLKASNLDQDVTCLSGGNQQKVVLSRWLEIQPGILLLDDPCKGVDIGAKHDIYELMNRLCAQGVAMVLVSSEMPELLFMSDRIMVMHRGQMTLELTRDEATQEKILYAALGERKTHE
jgi:ABC-type sugar transport system ATPase subunit